ncbi:MAG: hypothetical protein ABW046_03130 [Actinoplanes sp.]
MRTSARYRYLTTKVAAIHGVHTVETVPQLTRVKQSASERAEAAAPLPAR